MRRTWFKDDDGTYYRNCPLVKRDMGRPMNLILFWRQFSLHNEWDEVYAAGVRRADKIRPWDRVTTPRPFRESYPDHPGLWILDEPDLDKRLKMYRGEWP